jgi:SAM-dependent methyltransferase
VTWISTKMEQFTYFAQQVGEHDWRGKYVLDFGGNIGNMLRDPHSTIDPARYWCLDIDTEALAQGKAAYPDAQWIFYDRYCFFFNPYGVRDLPLPRLDQRFDYIVAYSVFPNTGHRDLLQLVGQLEALLAPGGALAFTFIDPHHRSWPGKFDGDNFRWRLERELGDVSGPAAQEMIARARRARWCLLVNAEELYVETDEIRAWPAELQKSCHVYYTAEYMKSLFPRAEILPPANNEMQHCCVIRK